MSQAGFQEAFDSIEKIVEQAARMPDHRERPVESPTVTYVTPRGEIQVTVHDALITSIRLDDRWFEDVTSDEAADQIAAATNKALDEWNREQMEQIRNVTPDMKELSAAIQAANAQLDQAWYQSVAESKVNPA